MEQSSINLTAGIRQMLFLLVGPTRSGKSTFIITLVGRQVAEEGKERNYHSTTRSIANYNNLGLDLDAIMQLENIENPPLIMNFMDTIGLGDTSVEYTDEEIQQLIRAELMDKTLCDKIDAIIIVENPNFPSIQLGQTFHKIAKIFGVSSKESVMVVISQAASVADIPEAIDQRIDECDKLNIPYIEQESKDIPEHEKQIQVKEFFEIVTKLQPYNIMKLRNFDQQLLYRARELREDPRNWHRRLRKDKQKEIIEWIRDPQGGYKVSRRIEKRWAETLHIGEPQKMQFEIEVDYQHIARNYLLGMSDQLCSLNFNMKSDK